MAVFHGHSLNDWARGSEHQTCIPGSYEGAQVQGSGNTGLEGGHKVTQVGRTSCQVCAEVRAGPAARMGVQGWSQVGLQHRVCSEPPQNPHSRLPGSHRNQQ